MSDVKRILHLTLKMTDNDMKEGVVRSITLNFVHL